MKRMFYLSGVFVALAFMPSARGWSDSQSSQWPSFRGRDAAGVLESKPTPLVWNVGESKNLKWTTPIPGLGHSSPIVWGDRLFVTTAVTGEGEQQLKVGMYGDVEPADEKGTQTWKLYCLDIRSGKVLWERTARTGVPKVKRHPKSSHANSTPATDGKHVVAFFGSEGLFCYNMAGKLLWKVDLGVLDSGFFRMPSMQWGFGSSPVIHNGRVIVQCDIQKNSFLAAYDVKTGREIWRTPRDEVPTWSVPTIVGSGANCQIVANGFKHIGGYDFRTGRELWRLKGGGDIPVPTPVVSEGLIFITNAHGGKSPIYAVRTEARGDLTLAGGATSSDSIAWSTPRGGCYITTPLVYGEFLYCCLDSGALTCYRAKTGQRLYEQKLEGAFTASPVAANGKLYLTNEQGEVFVVQAGPEFKLLSKNSLNDLCVATPAIAGGTLFFRTQHRIVAVSER